MTATRKPVARPRDLFVAFDTETTGFGCDARLVEIAALAFLRAPSGKIVSRFHTLVDPETRIPRLATEIHGITDEMVRGNPTARVALRRFLDWLPRTTALIAHNASFDIQILRQEFARTRLKPPSLPVIDTLVLARQLAETANNRLDTIARHHGWRRGDTGHRAAPDAGVVRRLFLRASKKIAGDLSPAVRLLC